MLRQSENIAQWLLRRTAVHMTLAVAAVGCGLMPNQADTCTSNGCAVADVEVAASDQAGDEVKFAQESSALDPSWQGDMMAEDALNALDRDGGADGLEAVVGEHTAHPPPMITIPAGHFWMGCAAEFCKDVSSENPLHLVWLDEYQMDPFETTVAEYAACVAQGECSVPQSIWKNFGGLQDYNWGAPDDRNSHPINGISRNQAIAYCAWRGKRLPTEAEWEKAARGGCVGSDLEKCKAQARPYPWGWEAPDCDRVVASFYPPSWGGGKAACEGPEGTRKVGSKPAGRSAYGLWDMAGNLGEPVSDWYDPAYYAVSPTANPLGPLTGDVLHVWRGDRYITDFDVVFDFALTQRGLDPMPDHVGSVDLGVRCAK